MASQGKTGITETPDYRGEEVLAAYTFIPRTRWGFVAKQDLNEIYASIQAMLLHMLIAVLISAAVVYFLASFVARILGLSGFLNDKQRYFATTERGEHRNPPPAGSLAIS